MPLSEITLLGYFPVGQARQGEGNEVRRGIDGQRKLLRQQFNLTHPSSCLTSAVTGQQQQDYAGGPRGEYWPEYDGYGNGGAGAASSSPGGGDNAGAAAGQYGTAAGAGAPGSYGAPQAQGGGYAAQPPQGPPQPVSHQ